MAKQAFWSAARLAAAIRDGELGAEYLEDRTALAAARGIEAETEGFVPPSAFAGED